MMSEGASRPDLAQALGTVSAAMTKTVLSVPSDMPASDALAHLYRQGVGGAPVVDHARVCGVVTITDLAAPRPYARETGPFLRAHTARNEWCVRDLMTESAVTAFPDEPLVDAVIRMARAHIDRLPVVNQDGQSIGILAREDVVHAVARAAVYMQTRAELRRRVLVSDRVGA